MVGIYDGGRYFCVIRATETVAYCRCACCVFQPSIFSGVQPLAVPLMLLLLSRSAHNPEIGNGLITFVPQRQGELSGISAILAVNPSRGG
jgi:hypothetical protein